MNITALELEALRKFNSGKNADPFKNDLEPGTYTVKLTVTLEGELQKGEPGITRRRNDSGSANIVRYLLDRINEATYARLLTDIDEIRKGNFDVKGPKDFARRLEHVMPYRQFPRSGSTRFNGQLFIEDIETPTPPEEVPKGLRIVGERP